MEDLIASVLQTATNMRRQLQAEGYSTSPLSSLSSQSSPQQQASEYITTEQHHQRVQKEKERKRLQRQRQRQRRRATQSNQPAIQSTQPATKSTQQVTFSHSNLHSWNKHSVERITMGTPSYLLGGTLHRAPNMGPNKSRDITWKVVYPTGIG